ncbi:GFA family protein [Thiobacillus sp.]|uniref:GFA family protein n=1 Tax=Thiobacillus sp. TaxID=924 RepID=UPI0025F5FCE0|nr:GFA family protein [Thiobacillus sp.]MBT9538501.1 GFA family protein [Thiobacillus sp.]
MQGKCLCGEVEFVVSGTLPNLYQCHCSLCRKATGSAANAALIAPSGNFQWVCGQEHIASYVGNNGYRSDFCSKCGSPLPNPLKGRAEYWIPAGLLEDNANLQIAAHLHVGSKASWDVIASSGVQYREAPDLDSLLKVLRENADAQPS